VSTKLIRVCPWLALVGLLTAGCTIDLQLDTSDDSATDHPTDGTTVGGVTRLEQTVETIQTTDPRSIELPEPLVVTGQVVIIDQSVTVIIDPEEELVVEELPDRTVLGFDNQTGYDLYLRYLADGELQGVYVYDGETLLLEYPCLDVIELLSEDDIDPVTGWLVDSIELSDVFVNPDHFECGDALVIEFYWDQLEISIELVELL